MPLTAVAIRRLHAVDAAQLRALADLLIDCVEGGASVSFMHPLTPERALAFWRKVAEDVAAPFQVFSTQAAAPSSAPSAPAPRRILLIAEDEHGVCGSVQLVLDLPENQPHRADLVKLLVHRRARRRGVGSALVRAAEAAARDCGRTLLVLDAVTDGDAARLYARLGWIRAGDIPRYALMPRGGYCSTTYFYRDLAHG